MPQGVAQALVLGSFPFREQDKIVFLLTLQRGIIKAVAPGAGKAKNRFGSLLELFSEGEFHYYWNEEKEMVTLSKGEIQRSFFPLVSRPEALFHFSLMAETVLKFLPPSSATAVSTSCCWPSSKGAKRDWR